MGSCAVRVESLPGAAGARGRGHAPLCGRDAGRRPLLPERRAPQGL